jgi:hypothetical protein
MKSVQSMRLIERKNKIVFKTGKKRRDFYLTHLTYAKLTQKNKEK